MIKQFAGLVTGMALAGCSEEAPSFTSVQLASAEAAVSQLDAGRLARHVEALVETRAADTPEVVPWYADHTHTHLRSADYILGVLRGELGLDPVVHDTEEEGLFARNIIVDFAGSSADEPVVLLSAHHDAWFSGADDNGSGVAVLLEAARLMRGAQYARTVRVVFFDLEEYGLIGAGRFLKAYPPESVLAALNLDCVGFASSESGSQRAPLGLSLPSRGDFIGILANDPASRLLSQAVQLPQTVAPTLKVLGVIVPGDAAYPGTRDFLRSDHAPFWRAGIPALFFTDTASFRNRHYHTAEDLPESLDYEFLEGVARLVVGTVASLATEP